VRRPTGLVSGFGRCAGTTTGALPRTGDDESIGVMVTTPEPQPAIMRRIVSGQGTKELEALAYRDTMLSSPGGFRAFAERLRQI
jgi:hypothetical protein